MGESEFLNFLDTVLPYKVGTSIAIIFGCVTVITLAVVFIKKHIDKFQDKTITKYKEKKKSSDIVNSIDEIKTQLNDTNKSIEMLASETNRRFNAFDNNIQNLYDVLNSSVESLEANDKNIEKKINDLTVRVDAVSESTILLIESDKEGIKSYITEKYYSCADKGYISVHELHSVEARYEKYLKENGDSFIQELVTELRKLPHKKHLFKR